MNLNPSPSIQYEGEELLIESRSTRRKSRVKLSQTLLNKVLTPRFTLRVPHGKGELKGKEFNYEGEFLRGEFHGKGKYERNLKMLEGRFMNGEMEGIFYANGKRKFFNKSEELWKENELIGKRIKINNQVYRITREMNYRKGHFLIKNENIARDERVVCISFENISKV